MIIFAPGGANGVRYKSKVPWSCVYAEFLGLISDGRRRFKVSSQCGNNLHQICTGKFFVYDGKSCNKVVFKRLDCTFC